ncbi:histidine phosphatase family protein [Andreprevotia chitinilytica]|uniref:histidine phosphatase family protein n=1 Tax=Andreprevotia chitinilytica TaxID=396808 RepID=UPI000552A277|nr:histidine phosphatase family protein [Andreprevotia chitinilytica]
MALYLIRHPQPLVEPSICYGRLDLPLAEPVATTLAAICAQLPAAFTCYSSPLQRCRLLAEALHPQPIFDARLLELDFGRWEGMCWNDIGPAALDQWIASDYTGECHGGEGVVDLQARIGAWAQEQVGAAQAVVAVTHAGVIRTLLAQTNGWSVAESLQYPIAFGSVTLLDLQEFPR